MEELLMNKNTSGTVYGYIRVSTVSQRDDLTAKLISNLVIQVFSYVAETERNMNHQRTMEGLAAARARGVTLGRKPMKKPKGFPAIHAQWKAGKISARKAAETLGVSAPTFLKWANAPADA
jgi:DNA invertase Pin-like site-specific DNA recombinase